MKSVRRDWPAQPWEPTPEVASLLGPVSGNQINGVGEKQARRPQQVFWARNPDDIAHGPLLRAVVGRFNTPQLLREVYQNADRGPRSAGVAAAPPVQADAKTCTEAVKAFVLNQPGSRPAGTPGAGSEAECVGIAATRDVWVYQGQPSALPMLVVMGLVMNHEKLSDVSTDPEQPSSALEVAEQYNRGARVANHTAQWIRQQGYQARAHAGPWVGSLNLLPAAIAAGFGELGKHGSLISREHGSSFRLAAVETDMPLLADVPDSFGADDFCTRCRVCTDACPPQAISSEKTWVRGHLKWWVDFDKCMPYFNETYGCGICIAVCPWSTPGRAPKLAQTWAQRRDV